MNTNIDDIKWAREHLGNPSFFEVQRIRSAEKNKVFKIDAGDHGKFVLKQGPDLIREKERLLWLDGKLPVPKVIGWRSENGQDELLMSYTEGEDLAKLSDKLSSEDLINHLAQALRLIHSLETTDYPFDKAGDNTVFIHGDACLPNFIFRDDTLRGIIDVGHARLGDIKIDLAAAVWSLEHNIGKDLGLAFLKAYGFPNPAKEDLEELKQIYKNDSAEE